MFELLGSWLLGLGSSSNEVAVLRSTQLSEWFAQTPFPVLVAPAYTPDPMAIATLDAYLARLDQSGLSQAQQGVWLQSGSKVWGEHQGSVPLPAASLTKLATSLAALSTWGTNHQFETLISTTGTLNNGVLQGDLIIQGGGDPLYVWEEAIALANRLQQLGIQQVTGDLVITGNFSMNYEENPVKSGTLLKQAFDADRWPPEAAQQYLQMPQSTARPNLRILGQVYFTSSDALSARQPRPLIRHQSLPLAQLLKLMNIYSNNVMAQMLADLMGGAGRMAQTVAALTQVPINEVQLINGSGLGHGNQLSPRAASRILMGLSHQVEGTPWSLADLLPVSGRDVGTLEGRAIPRSAAVKTGSLWNVSALAGALPTQDRGVVWFTIINRGADLDGLRRQQDRMLTQLIQDWGDVNILPPDLQPGTESFQAQNQLGAPERIQQINPVLFALP